MYDLHHSRTGEMEAMDISDTPVRLLLWSPMGAGTHYNGPATSIFRLISVIVRNSTVEVTLAHATKLQRREKIFSSQVALPVLNETPKSWKILRLLRRLRYFTASSIWLVSNRHKFDVILLPSCNALTLPIGRLAQLFGKRVVGRIAAQSEVGEMDKMKRAFGLQLIRNSLLRHLDATIALSEDIRTSLEMLGVAQDNIKQIPNAADCSRFHPASEEEKSRARARFNIHESISFVAVCVGAVCIRKGQHIIAEAIGCLPDEAHLLIVGPVRDKAAMNLIQDTLGARMQRITIVDHIPDVEEAYFASDVFVLPSDGEGMPNAMVEAMACGLPVVGTQVSGIKDLINDSAAGCFVEREPKSLSSVLSRLQSEPEERLHRGRLARKYVKNNLDSPKIAQHYLRLLI
jgi:glycosyltransferase involved in cell wall biosynthesis